MFFYRKTTAVLQISRSFLVIVSIIISPALRNEPHFTRHITPFPALAMQVESVSTMYLFPRNR